MEKIQLITGKPELCLLGRVLPFSPETGKSGIAHLSEKFAKSLLTSFGANEPINELTDMMLTIKESETATYAVELGKDRKTAKIELIYGDNEICTLSDIDTEYVEPKQL